MPVLGIFDGGDILRPPLGLNADEELPLVLLGIFPNFLNVYLFRKGVIPDVYGRVASVEL